MRGDAGRDAPRPPGGLHLSGREAGEHAAQAGARRLLLTHLVPWADPEAMLAEAREAYDGPLELVRSRRRATTSDRLRTP